MDPQGRKKSEESSTDVYMIFCDVDHFTILLSSYIFEKMTDYFIRLRFSSEIVDSI